MITLSKTVKEDIKELINSELPFWKQLDSDDCYMDLTIACNDIGTAWNYQTGDNSFTGGCYGLPHWAVTSIDVDSDPFELYQFFINELEELLPDNR